MYNSDSALLDHLIRQAAITMANPVFLQRIDLDSLQRLLHQVQLECARRQGQFQPQHHIHGIGDWNLGQFNRNLSCPPGDGPYYDGRFGVGDLSYNPVGVGSPEQQAENLRRTFGYDGQKLTGARTGYAEQLTKAVTENETTLPHDLPVGTVLSNSGVGQCLTDKRINEEITRVGEGVKFTPEAAEPMRLLPIMVEGINFPLVMDPDDGNYYIVTPSEQLRVMMDEYAGITINNQCPGDYSNGDCLTYHVNSIQHSARVHTTNHTTGKSYTMRSTLGGLNTWYVEQALKLTGEQE